MLLRNCICSLIHQLIIKIHGLSYNIVLMTTTNPHGPTLPFLNGSHDNDIVAQLQSFVKTMMESTSSSPSSSPPSNPIASLLQGPVIPATTAVASSLLDGAVSVLFPPRATTTMDKFNNERCDRYSWNNN